MYSIEYLHISLSANFMKLFCISELANVTHDVTVYLCKHYCSACKSKLVVTHELIDWLKPSNHHISMSFHPIHIETWQKVVFLYLNSNRAKLSQRLLQLQLQLQYIRWNGHSPYNIPSWVTLGEISSTTCTCMSTWPSQQSWGRVRWVCWTITGCIDMHRSCCGLYKLLNLHVLYEGW